MTAGDSLPPRRHLAAPTDEELAAIVAAVEMVWPRPALDAGSVKQPVSLRWRFSGRWWSRSSISRRDRPWVGPG